MKKILCIIFLMVMTMGSVDAATIVQTIGDKDGFGIGIVPGPTVSIPSSINADGDYTDELLRFNLIGDYYEFDFSWTPPVGGIDTATIEIFHAWNTTAALQIDGRYLGQLTEAEGFSAGTWPDAQQAVIDTFDIPIATFASILADGALSVKILAPTWDGYFVDYIQLSIESNPVPEPTTALLFGLGILGLAGISRKELA